MGVKRMSPVSVLVKLSENCTLSHGIVTFYNIYVQLAIETCVLTSEIVSHNLLATYSQQEVAAKMGVSKGAVQRTLERFRKTGSYSSRPKSGRKLSIEYHQQLLSYCATTLI